MRNLKKIKLSNIDNSKLEKNQLNKILGGGNPCYDCLGCAGAASHMNKSISKYRSTPQQQE